MHTGSIRNSVIQGPRTLRIGFKYWLSHILTMAIKNDLIWSLVFICKIPASKGQFKMWLNSEVSILGWLLHTQIYFYPKKRWKWVTCENTFIKIKIIVTLTSLILWTSGSWSTKPIWIGLWYPQRSGLTFLYAAYDINE